MPKSAPAKTATQEDEELPMTAVKPSAKDLYIKSMQEKLAELSKGENIEENNDTNLTQEEETFKKRYGDLRRHAQQKEAALAKELADREEKIRQLTSASEQPMPKTMEEFEAWKEKYPDIVNFVEIIADQKANQRAGKLQEELGSLKEKLTETEKEKAFATLKSLVPDLEDILVTSQYKDWFANQPLFVQEELNTSDDPYKISYYMNIFKLSVGKSSKTKDSLAALDTAVRNTGVTPTKNSGGYKYTQSQIAKMSPEEFAAKEADIIEARNTGRILDDMSKRNSVFDM